MSRDVASTIEDLEFMDENGVSAVEAASRLGWNTLQSFYQWLRDHDANDLWLSMHGRDPEGSDWKAAVVAKPPAPEPARVTVIEAAAKSTRAATRRKAERARNLLEELLTTVAAEQAADREQAEARTEVERLERQLAEAKAKLKGSTVTPTVTRITAPKGDFPCPGCGKHFDTVQGQSLHQRRHCSQREDVPA